MNCQRQPEGRAEQVRASQYCKFLNHAAASDPDHLFDQKMETDPETACIARVGEPVNFKYQVIAGREDFSLCYVNEFDEENTVTGCKLESCLMMIQTAIHA